MQIISLDVFGVHFDWRMCSVGAGAEWNCSHTVTDFSNIKTVFSKRHPRPISASLFLLFSIVV